MCSRYGVPRGMRLEMRLEISCSLFLRGHKFYVRKEVTVEKIRGMYISTMRRPLFHMLEWPPSKHLYII